ncbi:EboA domain-containing protein [Kribbella sp. CA-253562]|uniref:EboA domain-containing protein n=1 Tax=Kribbella sp. CA-253562 TaxID=3239942 RepID=UPI003D8EBA8B
MKSTQLPVDVAAFQDRPLAEVFPAVTRTVGKGALGNGWTADEAVRATLLAGASKAEIAELYRFGDTNEKSAILKALRLEDIQQLVGKDGIALVEDAIRTNDQRLLAAALGPYATKHLPSATFRQAVLKCVFAGVPLAAVDGLPERADDELRRMMADFAAERRAAGRSVPEDLQPYLER